MVELQKLNEITGKYFVSMEQILAHLPHEIKIQDRLCTPIVYRREGCWVAKLHSFGKAQFAVATYTDEDALLATAKLALFVLGEK